MKLPIGIAKLRTLIWPRINDHKSAKTATFRGVIACGCFCLATAVAVLFFNADKTAYLHILVFAALGLGVLKRSRLAASLALAAYLYEKSDGNINGITIIVLLSLIASVRGSFAYHRFKTVPQRSIF